MTAQQPPGGDGNDCTGPASPSGHTGKDRPYAIVPDAAVDAAAGAMPGLTREHAAQVAREALEAAAPLIAAAEREYCAELAEQEARRGQKPGLDRIILRSFAATLRELP